MIPGVDIQPGGLCRVVGAPSYGRQDVGHSPGGPSDRLGMRSGNILLDQNQDAPAVEIIFSAGITFTAESLLVLTGAPRAHAVLHRKNAAFPIGHGQVTHALPKDRLQLGPPDRGMRTYLCVRRQDAGTADLLQRARPAFDQLCHYADPAGAIRVTAGPEADSLQNPDAFFAQPWRLTDQMSDLGLTLEPAHPTSPSIKADPPEITSSPVNDGTIQLTPKGPLVLLRQRTTLGGYPRIANVIDVDIDRLAQHRPREIVRFRRVQPEEAMRLYRQREADLTALRESFV